MKIALISDWYFPRVGGLEMQMRDLARELVRAGHQVEVITVTPGEPTVDGIFVHRLNLPRLPKVKVGWQTRMVPMLTEILQTGNFDIVHSHSALSPLALAGALVARRLDIPSVLTEHSVLKGLGSRLLGTVNRFLHWAKWPNVLTAVSSYLAEEVHEVTQKQVLILPNGVRPEEWRVAPAANPAEPIRIVSVMRMTKRKRPMDIVRAIPGILARLPAGQTAHFTIVGDGPERERVAREAAHLGVTAHLDLVGRKSRAEVVSILQNSALFILPTSKEALSIATLEALSSGLPVVAMNHGGIKDIVHTGREGYLCEDTAEFSDRIVELAANHEKRQAMARLTVKATERFAWPHVIARHLEIYRLAESRLRADRPRTVKPVASPALTVATAIE